MKKSWNRHIFKWTFRNEATIHLGQKRRPGLISGFKIQTPNFPSNLATLHLFFNLSTLANGRNKKVILKAVRRILAEWKPLEFSTNCSPISVTFRLKKPGDVCRATMEIANFLFEKFNIVRHDGEGSADFDLIITPFIREGKDSWIPLSTALAIKYGLKF